MRRIIVITCVTAALTGCGGPSTPTATTGPPATPTTSTVPTPTYELPARPVRVNETPVKAAPVDDGDTRFQVIGIQAGQGSLSGSHAEVPAKGQLPSSR